MLQKQVLSWDQLLKELLNYDGIIFSASMGCKDPVLEALTGTAIFEQGPVNCKQGCCPFWAKVAFRKPKAAFAKHKAALLQACVFLKNVQKCLLPCLTTARATRIRNTMFRMTSKIAIALTPPRLSTRFLSKNMRQPSAVTVTVPSAMTCRHHRLHQLSSKQGTVSNMKAALVYSLPTS